MSVYTELASISIDDDSLEVFTICGPSSSQTTEGE